MFVCAAINSFNFSSIIVLSQMFHYYNFRVTDSDCTFTSTDDIITERCRLFWL